MKFTVLTLFPEMFQDFFSTSIIGRAVEKGVIECSARNIRDYAFNKHKSVDDYPYGGGSGMVMQVEPLKLALEDVKNQENARVIYLTPKGKTLSQSMMKDFSREEHLIMICGHYEGVDQRFIDKYVTDEVSLGDFVLTGGELPAMVLIDGVSRMVEGVLSSNVSFEDESHFHHLLEYPHYTRPAIYEEVPVPDVLLSGNHLKVDAWRLEQSVRLTMERRPELIEKFFNDPSIDEGHKNKVKKIIKNIEL
ncbi:MAG: tRNA (guanosine(37)-N1)-methyltransferase TrmD [Clostridia bacterium]|nr:tRNA (guanosine(37)-N1)-methyltransferase TrmD [Clostridia bacterium]